MAWGDGIVGVHDSLGPGAFRTTAPEPMPAQQSGSVGLYGDSLQSRRETRHDHPRNIRHDRGNPPAVQPQVEAPSRLDEFCDRAEGRERIPRVVENTIGDDEVERLQPKGWGLQIALHEADTPGLPRSFSSKYTR